MKVLASGDKEVRILLSVVGVEDIDRAIDLSELEAGSIVTLSTLDSTSS